MSQLVYTMKPKLPFDTQVCWARLWRQNMCVRAKGTASTNRTTVSAVVGASCRVAPEGEKKKNRRTRSSHAARVERSRMSNAVFANQVFRLTKLRLALASQTGMLAVLDPLDRAVSNYIATELKT